MKVSGNVIFPFKGKLKLLKGELRIWNKDVFGYVDLGVEETIKELSVLDFEVANKGAMDVEVMACKRASTSNRVCESSFAKESMLRKKAKQKWLVEGDYNSKFFHQAMKQRLGGTIYWVLFLMMVWWIMCLM